VNKVTTTRHYSDSAARISFTALANASRSPRLVIPMERSHLQNDGEDVLGVGLDGILQVLEVTFVVQGNHDGTALLGLAVLEIHALAVRDAAAALDRVHKVIKGLVQVDGHLACTPLARLPQGQSVKRPAEKAAPSAPRAGTNGRVPAAQVPLCRPRP